MDTNVKTIAQTRLGELESVAGELRLNLAKAGTLSYQKQKSSGLIAFNDKIKLLKAFLKEDGESPAQIEEKLAIARKKVADLEAKLAAAQGQSDGVPANIQAILDEEVPSINGQEAEVTNEDEPEA